MDISARISHDHVDHTQDNTAHLVVTLKAPTLDWVQKRPQLCVLPVIDLSGSMCGAKLNYAKQSMEKLVDQLQDGDYAGLLGFETQVHVLAAPQKVDAEFKQRLKNVIRKLQVMGSTNFSEGLIQAAQAVERLDLGPAYLKRIIMFTDGYPTCGITDPKVLLKMISNRGQNGVVGPFDGVSISAFGYGETCDHQFLTEFASFGRGNYAFVQNPDDALSAFGKELGGLLSTYATNIEVSIEPSNGHHIASTITNIPVETDATGLHEISIPDVLSEETRHFVFEVKLLKQPKALPREFTVFNVKAAYDVVTEAGKKDRRTAEDKVKVRFVKPDDAQKSASKELADIIALHKVIRAQLEAEEEAKKGNFKAAEARMNHVFQDAEVKTSGGILNAARGVSKRLVSPQQYAAGQGYLRSMASAGTRGYGTSSIHADAREALLSCNVALNNNAMDQVTQAFREPVEPLPPIDVDVSNKSG